eukprot:EG_transcript_14134
MSLADVCIATADLEQMAADFGLGIHHSQELGAYVRTEREVDEDGGLLFTTEKPVAIMPEDPTEHVCGFCCHLLEDLTNQCPACPQKYCSCHCEEADVSHAVICRGRSKAGARLQLALERLEAHCVDAGRHEALAVHLALRIFLRALAFDPTGQEAPLPFLQPLPYHEKVFARSDCDAEQEYKSCLADVFFCLLRCCFRPHTPFYPYGVPKWMSFTGFAQLCSAVHCNAFEVNLGEYDDEHAPTGYALFPFHSQLSHSCNPNCVYLCAMVPGGPPFITLQPARTILAGEQVTISYMMLSLLRACGGVLGRRALLCAVRRFVCMCEVCTEEAKALRPQLLAQRRFVVPECLEKLCWPSLEVGLEVIHYALGRAPLKPETLACLDAVALAHCLVEAVVDHICAGPA